MRKLFLFAIIIAMTVSTAVAGDSCICINPPLPKAKSSGIPYRGNSGKGIVRQVPSSSISNSFNTTNNFYGYGPQPLRNVAPVEMRPISSYDNSMFPVWFWPLLAAGLIVLLAVIIWRLIPRNSPTATTPPVSTERASTTSRTSQTSMTENKERDVKALLIQLQTTGGNINWTADGAIDMKVPEKKPDTSAGLEKATLHARETGAILKVYSDGGYRIEFPKPEAKKEQQ